MLLKSPIEKKIYIRSDRHSPININVNDPILNRLS